MKLKGFVAVAGFLLIYGILFLHQETIIQQNSEVLDVPLPAVVQKTALGYVHQLGGIMHFIKSAIFIGGNFSNHPSEAYANGLSANLMVASELHPRFIDTYFLTQATLASIGPQWTLDAIEIQKNGLAVFPENWILPFFISFNYQHYLNEPRQSAEYLKITADIEGAPRWLEHLASLRAGQGGDILAGLIWLKAMYNGEDNEAVRNRYQREIVDFEKALEVEKAVMAYHAKFGRYPEYLVDLIPEQLNQMPEFEAGFELEWDPPRLSLVRKK